MRLEVAGHAVEALAEIGELVAAGNRDAVRQVAFGKGAGAAQELGERRAEPLQEQHYEGQRQQNGDDGMDLTDPLEPAQEPRRVGVDPINLGGLVGDSDLDKLIELLVDAALQKGEADVAAIDCVTLAYVRRYQPQALAELVEVGRSPQVPGLPFVTIAGDGISIFKPADDVDGRRAIENIRILVASYVVGDMKRECLAPMPCS
jgi:hypothetical protein